MEFLRFATKVVLCLVSAVSFTWSALMLWMLYKARSNDIPRQKLTVGEISLFSLLLLWPPVFGALCLFAAHKL